MEERRILIVDDTPSIHEDIRLSLGQGATNGGLDAIERGLFGDEKPAGAGAAMQVDSAYQGEEGARKVAAAVSAKRPYALAFVDMRMPPGWDGLKTIQELWKIDPALQVVICTAYSDSSWSDIVTALGERDNLLILKKPFDPIEVTQLAHALTQKWRLAAAEKDLLEKTLKGSVQALVDALALTNPRVFGRADRLRRLVSETLDALSVVDRWSIEVAALVSQLGAIVLPPEVAARADAGASLTREEEAMVKRVPAVTEQLLKHIPRLESVREILLDSAPASNETVKLGRRLLRIAVDFDRLDTQGTPVPEALSKLRARGQTYDRELLEAFARVHAIPDQAEQVCEVSVREIAEGMRVAEDLRLRNGLLLVTRGYRVTVGFVERLRNFPPGALAPRVRVVLPNG